MPSDNRQNENLALSNLFQYDFSACYYNILKNTGFDVSTLPFEDKKKRNILIGYLQKNNKSLANYLSSSVENLVDFYLEQNNISFEDIILRQKDGLVLKKPMEKTNITMPINFVGVISKLIFTVDRNRWLILYDNGTCVTKGFSNLPIDTDFFNLFKNLDYSNSRNLSIGMERIRQIIHNTDNKHWFFTEDDDGYIVPIKNMGLMKFRKTAAENIDPSELDRSHLWIEFVWPLCRSLLIYCCTM